MSNDNKSNEKKNAQNSEKKTYEFGGIIEYKLEDIEAEVLNDNVYLDVFAGSDSRFKQDVKDFNGALGIVSKLGVYQYSYKNDEFVSKNFPKDEQVGVMAQELEGVLPHLVKTDAEGFRYVNYAGLSPVLLSAIKELTKLTNDQSELIKKLEKRIIDLEAKNK